MIVHSIQSLRHIVFAPFNCLLISPILAYFDPLSSSSFCSLGSLQMFLFRLKKIQAREQISQTQFMSRFTRIFSLDQRRINQIFSLSLSKLSCFEYSGKVVEQVEQSSPKRTKKWLFVLFFNKIKCHSSWSFILHVQLPLPLSLCTKGHLLRVRKRTDDRERMKDADGGERGQKYIKIDAKGC